MNTTSHRMPPYKSHSHEAIDDISHTITRSWTYPLTTNQFTGLPDVDPFDRPTSFFLGLGKAFLATAICRCWQHIVFFTVEAFIVVWVSKNYHDISIQNTLMNVLGVVIGFALSYRTSSAFERYNEGRRYWSQVVYNVRMFGRCVWFHIPEKAPLGAIKAPAKNDREYRARTLIEKKTILNLLEAFAVSLKHYLRGEEGTHYQDLHPLVKFLPAYALPAGIPTPSVSSQLFEEKEEDIPDLPLPASTGVKRQPTITIVGADGRAAPRKSKISTATAENPDSHITLLPARDPPKRSIFDFFPFSLFIRVLHSKGNQVKGRKALRDRARSKGRAESGNVPLEITFYLSSYLAMLQNRNLTDGLSIGLLHGALGQMVDALTGLERILTTPIPFAYSIHLWVITLLYLITLPFQLYGTLEWLTIPAVALAAFTFTGLMKLSEEIENPFGYDYNDLNMDHFTHNIIRNELRALTSMPIPDPSKWIYVPDNDEVFEHDFYDMSYLHPNDQHPSNEGVSPEEWVRRGSKEIKAALGHDVSYPLTPDAAKVASGHGQSTEGTGSGTAARNVAGGAIASDALSDSTSPVQVSVSADPAMSPNPAPPV